MTTPLTRQKAEDTLVKVRTLLAERCPDSAEQAILQDPGAQCSGWCITLEASEAFDFWPGYITDRIGDELQAVGVFAEPVTHCHLGLYPAPNAEESRTNAQIADDYERAVATGNEWGAHRVAAKMAKRLRER